MPVGLGLVFCRLDGSPLLPTTVTRAFTRTVRAVGLPGVRFHDLRHTHATLMLRQGVHPKIVSERLGHSTISITLDTYSHVLPGLQEAAALRFDEGLPSEATKTPVETHW
jgi:integrase